MDGRYEHTNRGMDAWSHRWNRRPDLCRRRRKRVHNSPNLQSSNWDLEYRYKHEHRPKTVSDGSRSKRAPLRNRRRDIRRCRTHKRGSLQHHLELLESESFAPRSGELVRSNSWSGRIDLCLWRVKHVYQQCDSILQHSLLLRSSLEHLVY